MRETLKNYEIIPHHELVHLHGRSLVLLRQEYEANVKLRAQNQQLENKIKDLKNRLECIFNECKIILQ